MPTWPAFEQAVCITMITIKAYQTPQQFLDDTEELLEQRALENNLILGLSNGIGDKAKVYAHCVFINAIENNQIVASSIKTHAKAIVSATTKNTDHIKALVDYYLSRHIELQGVFGETFYAGLFAGFYMKPQIRTTKLLMHRLKTVNDLSLVPGTLEKANDKDTGTIVQWMLNFEEDANTFPKQSSEQIQQSVRARIASGNFYKWVDKDVMVSVAALVRKTKQLGFIGYVYTPEALRGKGYASSCVQQLSKQILQEGMQYCGLFTDQQNPTSNHIYRKIGYVPITEFSDIAFA